MAVGAPGKHVRLHHQALKAAAAGDHKRAFGLWLEASLDGDYDNSISRGAPDRSLLDAGKSHKYGAFALYGIGGAMFVAGVDTLILNRPRLATPDHAAAPERPRWILGAGPTQGGLHVTLGGRF